MVGIGSSGAQVGAIPSVDAMGALAGRRLPRVVSDFIEGGAEDERTLRRNRSAFAGIELRPRVLVDVSVRDLAVEVCGTPLALPVLLAPVGLTGLIEPDAEIGAARAAHRAGTALAVSSASTRSLEEVADRAGGNLWFQLYPWRDRGLTGSLVDRAQEAGYRALCVTVDVPVTGSRERDLVNRLAIPLRLSPRLALEAAGRPRWLWRFLRARPVAFGNLDSGGGAPAVDAMSQLAWSRRLMDPGQDWSTLAWIREKWRGPLLVKGVLDPGDAVRAVECGADGIVVSNHGGRQLDGVPAVIDALPGVVDAVEGRAEVLLDGGVRRGTDVVKALALGARACLIGRPYLYGLAVAGEAGVSRVLELLAAEIDRSLALLGCPRVVDLDRSVVTLSRQ